MKKLILRKKSFRQLFSASLNCLAHVTQNHFGLKTLTWTKWISNMSRTIFLLVIAALASVSLCSNVDRCDVDLVYRRRMCNFALKVAERETDCNPKELIRLQQRIEFLKGTRHSLFFSNSRSVKMTLFTLIYFSIYVFFIDQVWYLFSSFLSCII